MQNLASSNHDWRQNSNQQSAVCLRYKQIFATTVFSLEHYFESDAGKFQKSSDKGLHVYTLHKYTVLRKKWDKLAAKISNFQKHVI